MATNLYILLRAGILRRLTLSECSKKVESLSISRAQVRLIHTASPCTAGHAKWQNIKHIKEANDKIKGQKSNFLSGRLQILFAKNSDKDPKTNTELANLIKWARTNNIPNDVIERAIDREVKLRDPKNITVFDGRGLSNAGIIVECFALKPLHTKNLLQGIIKKYGFSLNVPAMDLFEHKGKINMVLSETDKTTALTDTKFLDKYVDLAIEAGAEDVKLEEGSYGHNLEFLCSPSDLDKVYKNLEQAGLQLTSSERVYIPKVEVPVSQEYLNELDKLTEKLDTHPDVVNYYFNLVPES